MGYWKDTLLIGVPAIDEQHKKLVAAIDELMDACSKGQGRDAVGKTLKHVIDYTKTHFVDEEKIQSQSGYPGYHAHKQIHTKFAASIVGLKNDFEQNGPSIALTAKINKTLVEWLVNHITTEDKKIGEYIKSKK